MRQILLTALILLSFSANAQRLYGVATSNWSGTNGIYLNPANVADSRHRFTIDLFAINAGADNDKGTFSTAELFNRDSFNIGSVLKVPSGNKSFNLTAPYLEVRGPGFMWSIDKKSGVALTTRVRLYNQFQDFNVDLFNAVTSADFNNLSTNPKSYAIDADRFNWTLHAWTEVGATYGRVLVDKGAHMVKGGVTARYIGGVSYVNFQANTLKGTFNSKNDSLRIDAADAQISSNVLSTQDEISGSLSGGDIANYFFGSKGGSGFGLDLGLVYEWRPDNNTFKYDMDGVKGIDDNTVNRYKLRFSAAITDIGSVTYKKENKTASMRGSGSIVTDSVKANNFTEFSNYMKARGLDVAIDSNSSTTVKLPTAIQLNVDYNFGKNFYANLAYNGNLVDRFVAGNTYYSQLTLTPRYDTRIVSFGLPVTYNFFSQKLKVGAGLRVGGFFFGSDDMLAFLGSNSQTGANFYFGAGIPFNKRKPRDSDGDKVSDKRDSCINVRGPWEAKGCPILDKDGDGILDDVDKCPDVAGAKTALGCPDSDLDSVADASDACPTEAGLVSLAGCPDRDKDGIADKDDACPDAPGTALMRGCPDTDGDGVADNVDECPEKPGPVANNGCPDTDNDGITDNKDRCPTVPGTIANQGCPEIKAEVKKRLAFVATAIQFETGKAIIKPASFKLLDDIVNILNEYSDYSMRIEGHTDNVGKPDKNLILSRDRAASVKAYFVSKGIPDARLITDGFGDTKPAANNKTAAGRAKNRRVEMTLFLAEDRR